MAPLDWLFEILAIVAFGCEVWALVDALRHPAAAFTAASKLTKPIWLIILGVALVIGLAGWTVWGGAVAINILPIGAFAAAAIYLTDVRPKVGQFKPGTHSGPYGPW